MVKFDNAYNMTVSSVTPRNKTWALYETIHAYNIIVNDLNFLKEKVQYLATNCSLYMLNQEFIIAN